MPTYDYECDACGHAMELFQGINEPVKKKCPECGKLKLRRLFGTGAAIMFKGSGFYQTDYRSEGYKKAAKADKKSNSDSKSESKSESKSSDSKPAKSEKKSSSGD
ncbi:zinc ribbon domain-containing protein [Stieleria sp. TO1_6]|uniref:FmdB family zinc ribbon protein n=1 Tax=Stieleria tagensis TaxID=2956795 RepID=UPI00209ABE1E|nr:zinc ribbon domain-containing protein [Stieleria tagensis]MCO8123772.1 zinc ribbon domain-containing protein [Stieleria tagensis]